MTMASNCNCNYNYNSPSTSSTSPAIKAVSISSSAPSIFNIAAAADDLRTTTAAAAAGATCGNNSSSSSGNSSSNNNNSSSNDNSNNNKSRPALRGGGHAIGNKKVLGRRRRSTVGHFPVDAPPAAAAAAAGLVVVVDGKECTGAAAGEGLGENGHPSDSQHHRQHRHHQHQQSHQCRHQQQQQHQHGQDFLLMEQVKSWISHERARLQSVRERRRQNRIDTEVDTETAASEASLDLLETIIATSSISSASSASRPRLAAAATAPPLAKRPSSSSSSSASKYLKNKLSHASNTSDTEYASDGEALVPSCEVTLATAEEIGTDGFRREVLRLTHTLKCKGWRRVGLNRWGEVGVERISGALTNAVYMVSPPADIETFEDPKTSLSSSTSSSKLPSKLLLRIYGPQVSHLINRTTELSILRRLARKRIGPRLLGTFENGRFEQFFEASTLTKDDIRNPETSWLIAKRLKELHEGIELEDDELDKGAIAWVNWGKWMPRARGIMAVVDGEVLRRGGESVEGGAIAGVQGEEAWMRRGLVCGVRWERFEEGVEMYRQWLYARYGGEAPVREKLVFAHNDTQYGNILRLQASEKSPLLLPSNTHKQLVVIDFEYASASTPGFELGNHFCEWMANYHSPTKPYIMNTTQFPSLEQQREFITAYVDHSLNSPSSSAFHSSSTRPTTTTSSSSSSFALEPSGEAKNPNPSPRESREAGIENLLQEARAWRPASHAMWCAWGVVQAKVKGKEKKEEVADAILREEVTATTTSPTTITATATAGSSSSSSIVESRVDKTNTEENNHNSITNNGRIDKEAREEEKEEGGEEEEFDYLGYAQQRAMLFWGDLVTLGIVKLEELDPVVREKVKIVES